ncbi:sugar transferase [Listeria sp. PSOL-1]|uniref:sugar transferase n=1 Tax=Listeria sp. PSOL-1 TaxID=1844999 RepID=UPI001E454B15|nr:sugar transferase [Listeria sp. PSOL-1]
MKRQNLWFKTTVDYVISLFIMLILLVPFLILSVFLACYYRGNPFYVAERAGLKGKKFYQIKFKSMYDTDDNTEMGEQKRVSPVGKVLREWSIDEIPQLLNVLRGDISLVGPRPLTTEYIPLYSDFEKRRLEVKPGITGLAQVNGRNSIDWKEKFSLDVQYVDHYSIALDIKIIIQTISVVLMRKGVNQDEVFTARRYKG